MTRLRLQLGLCGAALLAAAGASAFTQFVPAVSCEGHEWITVASANKLMKKYPQLKNGMVIADDTKCPQCVTYRAGNFLVYSAVVGERHVDFGGLPGIPSTLGNACLNAIIQDPDELQHYHALRGRCEAGREGRNAAIEKTKGTVRALYKEAHAAQGEDGKGKRAGTVDGGATQQKTMVDSAFFLFGRAAHVFEDSFSPEHTIRAEDKNHRILDIKTYVCTDGAPMHKHGSSGPAPGDVVFSGVACIKLNPYTQVKSFQAGVKTFNPHAQWAVDAMVDLWTAFLEKRADIEPVLSKWMSYNPSESPPPVKISAADRSACLAQQGTHSSQAKRRKRCLDLLAPAGSGGFKYWWPKAGAASLNQRMSSADIDKAVGAIVPATGTTCKDE